MASKIADNVLAAVHAARAWSTKAWGWNYIKVMALTFCRSVRVSWLMIARAMDVIVEKRKETLFQEHDGV